MSPRALLRRLAQAVATTAGMIVVTFLLIHLAPGDPVLALGGDHGDAGYYALIRARFGLDRPLLEQLAIYTASVARGDLGLSFVHGRSVAGVIFEQLPATVLLMGTALAISSAAGLTCGIAAALRADRPLDLALQTMALFGHAAPPFWLGQIAVLVFALGVGLFPVQGMSDLRHQWRGLQHVLDVLHHLALPALVLATGEAALTARLIRTGLLEAQRSDYVRTARAKGLPERTILRHALSNVLLPVVTVVGARVGMLFSGAVLVETVFAWPGLGRLLLSSVLARDYPVILGMFLVISVGVIIANFVTDLIYRWLDPRVTA